MKRERRAAAIVGLIAFAQSALFFFGLVPRPYNLVFLFLNGLPLGLVFGLVLGFLEGRRQTEALTGALCASFIVADGVTKAVGARLLVEGVSPYWMPFTAGLCFAPPLALFVWMLTRIPQPSAADVAARGERDVMTRADRRTFFAKYGTGLVLFVLVYLLVSILRSIRGDFATEIWQGMGTRAAPQDFAESEIVIAVGVTLANGLFILIRDNRLAFFVSLALCLGGFALIGLALTALSWDWLSPFAFMVLFGLGLLLPYVVFQATLFERLIAITRDRGNLGYLVYVADAFGYLGVVAVLFARNLWPATGNFLDFFTPLSWITLGISALLLVAGWVYFARHRVMAAAEV
jgi:hypothetical protein